jgi:flagellin
MRQLAIHAANEGVNDSAALQADQAEVQNILTTISRISDQAQFGNRKLLDGSMETTGTTTGNNLEFVKATLETGDSRENGFDVKVTQLSTRSEVTGTETLSPEIIKGGETLTIIENGKLASYKTNRDDTSDTTIKNLQAECDKKGLNVDVSLNAGGQINVIHREYGSDYNFQVSSSTAGVLSKDAGDVEVAEAGLDIKGTINGESTTGKGQILTGVAGAKCVDGLQVKYYGDGKEGLLPSLCEVNDLELEEGQEPPERLTNEDLPEDGVSIGRVYVTQNGTKFHIGGNKYQTVGLSIRSCNPEYLAMDIANYSGFENLADVDLTTHQGAQDTLMIVDAAIDQVLENRGELGAFQKNTLESNLSNIRIANENLVSSESIIRDTDMAKEMANFTRNQIMSQSSNAMLAQANQIPENVMQLIA